jgi:hypothetical protein
MCRARLLIHVQATRGMRLLPPKECPAGVGGITLDLEFSECVHGNRDNDRASEMEITGARGSPSSLQGR